MKNTRLASFLFALHVLASAVTAVTVASAVADLLPSQWQTAVLVVASAFLFVLVMIVLFWILRITQFVRRITALLMIVRWIFGGMNE